MPVFPKLRLYGTLFQEMEVDIVSEKFFYGKIKLENSISYIILPFKRYLPFKVSKMVLSRLTSSDLVPNPQIHLLLKFFVRLFTILYELL